MIDALLGDILRDVSRTGNHYRLLFLEVFGSDLNLIRNLGELFVVYDFFSSNLTSVVLLIYLQNAFTRLIPVHDWHVEVHKYEIKMLWLLLMLLSRLDFLKLVELQHVLLNCLHSQIPVESIENPDAFKRLKLLLNHHLLEWLVIYQQYLDAVIVITDVFLIDFTFM